jgi:hypothetical protein
MTVEDLHRVAEASAGQSRRLADVLVLTRDMLEQARAGDWDAVTALEQRRRDDLKSCFAGATSAEHSELVAEALAVILHLNEELMACLRTARDEVLRRGVEQARTRSAIGQYQGVQHGQLFAG